MPKQTFFSLPEEKRQGIIEAAYDEFLNKSYKSASIARISNKADIPVGSFYQYFEDKYDLVRFLCNQVVNLFDSPYEAGFWSGLDRDTAMKMGLDEKQYTFMFEVSNSFPAEVQNQLFFDSMGEAYTKKIKEELVALQNAEETVEIPDIDFAAYLFATAPFIVQEFARRSNLSPGQRFAYNSWLNDILNYGIKKRT